MASAITFVVQNYNRGAVGTDSFELRDSTNPTMALAVSGSLVAFVASAVSNVESRTWRANTTSKLQTDVEYSLTLGSDIYRFVQFNALQLTLVGDLRVESNSWKFEVVS
jgi:predicted RNase H-related nuclease YkuK (DUF458 family)